MGSDPLPRAVLLDLDDTILDDSSNIAACWREACASQAHRLVLQQPDDVFEMIQRTSKWFWDDPERHRTGRLELNSARREVVHLALKELGIEDVDLAAAIGDAYAHGREVGIEPLPEAIETVGWLRAAGCRLALITNGAGHAQRRKIERFGLANLFDAILVEGEIGFGKPDERVYRLALETLRVEAIDAWMVGDNLDWDVAAPQQLGVFSIWVDRKGRGLPTMTHVRPDRIIRGLSDLRSSPINRTFDPSDA
jgi:putative hydrolase of the HAD superfamily